MHLGGEIMLQNWTKSPINEAGPRVLETLATPNRNAPIQEAQMAISDNIGLRGDSASADTPDNWKPIGLLALAHVRRVLDDAPKAEARK